MLLKSLLLQKRFDSFILEAALPLFFRRQKPAAAHDEHADLINGGRTL